MNRVFKKFYCQKVDKFLSDLNLQRYKPLLLNHGIDSFEKLLNLNESVLDQMKVKAGPQGLILSKIKRLQKLTLEKQFLFPENIMVSTCESSTILEKKENVKEIYARTVVPFSRLISRGEEEYNYQGCNNEIFYGKDQQSILKKIMYTLPALFPRKKVIGIHYTLGKDMILPSRVLYHSIQKMDPDYFEEEVNLDLVLRKMRNDQIYVFFVVENLAMLYESIEDLEKRYKFIVEIEKLATFICRPTYYIILTDWSKGEDLLGLVQGVGDKNKYPFLEHSFGFDTDKLALHRFW